MTAVARVGLDIAGSTISGPGAPTVFINGLPCSVLGDDIVAHGPIPHQGAKVITGSATVFAMGKPVVRIGDLASCGHTVSTGSQNVFAG